jgi:hypothetical protein
MFTICFTQTKLTSINCNDEINNHSFQTIYLIVAQFLKQKLIFFIKTFLYRYFFNFNYNIYYIH